MRVNTVDKARKSPGACGRCHDEIPVGAAYRWAKPRYGSKAVRCAKPDCRFRGSELTGSDKISRVRAAGESVEDACDRWDGSDVSAIKSALDDAASEVRDVAQEYTDAAEAMGGAGSENEERAAECESFADELESAEQSIDEYDGDEDEEEARATWVEETKSTATDAAASCPL